MSTATPPLMDVPLQDAKLCLELAKTMALQQIPDAIKKEEWLLRFSVHSESARWEVLSCRHLTDGLSLMHRISSAMDSIDIALSFLAAPLTETEEIKLPSLGKMRPGCQGHGR